MGGRPSLSEGGAAAGEGPVIDVHASPAESEATLSAPDFESGWWRMPPVGERPEVEPFPPELLRPRSPRWLRRLRASATGSLQLPILRQLAAAVALAAVAIAAASLPGLPGRATADAVVWTLHRDYDPVAVAASLARDVPGLPAWLKAQGFALPVAAMAPPASPTLPRAPAATGSATSPYATPMGKLVPPVPAPVAVAYGAPVLVPGGGGKTAPSQGILFWATASAPAHAIASGQVLAATASPTLGRYVLINHAGGWSSLYAHCESVLVQPGAQVTQGQSVCTTGRVGSQFGPYLYFELRTDGRPVDPGPYLGLKEAVSR